MVNSLKIVVTKVIFKKELTENLSAIDAHCFEDLTTTWMLSDKGRDVVNSALNNSPAVELRVVLSHII